MEKEMLENIYSYVRKDILGMDKFAGVKPQLIVSSAMSNLELDAYDIAEERYGKEDAERHYESIVKLLLSLAEFSESDYKFTGILKLLGFKVKC